jgi:hypothetical protein
MTTQRPQGIAALESRPLRLPRAGRIRLGEKEVNDRGKEYPRELDYFNCTDAPLVGDVYGEKPRAIDVIFPTNDKRAIADTCYMRYGQSGPKCRGNGVTAWDMETGKERECLGEECEHASGDRPSCKRQMILTFVCYMVPGLCVYDLVTSGWRSIENTLAFLDTLESLFGRIDGLPLKMYREPYDTTRTDKDGKRKKQVHHCIRLDLEASLLDVKRLQLGGGAQMELPPAPVECADDMYPKSLQTEEAAALPPGVIVDTETGEIVSPPLAAVPDTPDVLEGYDDDPVYQLAKGGMDILDLDRAERLELLYKYRDDADGLCHHIGAVIDSQLVEIPQKPEPNPVKPARARKPQEPAIEGPAKPQGRYGF